MTKVELHNHIKSVSEDYVSKCWGTFLDLDEIDLISAGIGVGKIIASEQEKRITELEKENAELKDDNKVMADNYSKMEQKVYDNLTKAKEIIQKLQALYFSPVVTNGDVKRQDEILAEAEQFLKECEK